MLRHPLSLALLALAMPHLGCEEEHDHSDHEHETPATTQSVKINFALTSGDELFACTKTFSGLGRANSTWTPRDAKLYVHDVKLINKAGAAVPVTIIEDGAWQHDGIVLLDFEDGTGTCSNGNAAKNATIRGEIAVGEYKGISFKIGVPFEHNHQDAAAASSPLNVTSMFWSWQAGYKFLRIDGATDGLPMGVLLHLGSTGCMMGDDNVVSSCANPNRPAITLTDFTQDKAVVLDLKELFADAHLDADEGGAPGCMSSTDDPDCAPIFRNLGLPFGDPSHTAQRAFRVAAIEGAGGTTGVTEPGHSVGGHSGGGH
jgi:uncharacterized repeat protein (TIGR04052 family)